MPWYFGYDLIYASYLSVWESSIVYDTKLYISCKCWVDFEEKILQDWLTLNSIFEAFNASGLNTLHYYKLVFIKIGTCLVILKLIVIFMAHDFSWRIICKY